eukprot:TRINITY_DN20713_c0_g2_i1.p1 TRINITY_DN20713_c0_g2~~TRINITY_DN20713_c0_g2_i1.p1  ORF type:complete len:218 (+),score=63.25 TRINITY_DN20713_c0_g2_i1:65-718(+)
MSKLTPETLKDAITKIYTHAKETKPRKFVETVELQIGLKNYDPSKDKRFAGSIKLPFPIKPRIKFCVLGDQIHCDEAQKMGIPFKSQEDLKNFKRNKKKVKQLAQSFDHFVASESIIRVIPKLLGPGLNKAQKFPTLITHTEPLEKKLSDIRQTVKFQLRKVLCMSTGVGDVSMDADDLQTNATIAVNFLVSLLKKHWQNVKSLHLKSTMGPPQRIY